MECSGIGNADLINEVNRKLVLHAVRSLQPTFRAEVARRTNLNPATVTSIVAELLRDRVLKEILGERKPPSASGGRPPMMLQLNNRAKQVLAIDLEPDIVRVALVGLAVQIEAYRERVIDRHSQPALVIGVIVELCHQVLRDGWRRRVDGIGLSLPGLIDREQGILISSTNMPQWHNVPIRDLLAEQLEIEPKIERAVHLAAMYEDWAEPTNSKGTQLVLSLRTGIGMSLMRDGELYSGAGGFDGEVGHTVIDLEGELCECGNRGCLETFVSADSVCARAARMMAACRCLAVAAAVAQGEPLRPELVYRLAKEGDPDCAEIVRDVGRYVGLAAANLVNLLAPDSLILCGSIDTADELILQVIREQINTRSLQQLQQHLIVRLARGKEKSALLGAAVLIVRELFDLPRLLHPQAMSTG